MRFSATVIDLLNHTGGPLVLIISIFFFLVLAAFVLSDVWTRGMLEIADRPPIIGG